jgi:hypothetical protein
LDQEVTAFVHSDVKREKKRAPVGTLLKYAMSSSFGRS